MEVATEAISVLVGPTCPMCASDDLRWAAPLGAVQWGQCRNCGTEYRWYTVEPEEPLCASCESPLPEGTDREQQPYCEDCELSDCAFCGVTVHRFELSENLACPTCETGEVAA
jgi:hypothetical protein